MKKENIRILFNKDKDGRIYEFEIAEFVKGDKENCPMHLYEKYDSDIGNCLSYWDEYTLVDIILNLGYKTRFQSRALGLEFIKELSRVEEFRDKIRSLYHIDEE